MFKRDFLLAYSNEKFVDGRLELIKAIARIEAKFHSNEHSQKELELYFQYRAKKNILPKFCEEIDENFVTLLNFHQLEQYKKLLVASLEKVLGILGASEKELLKAGKQKDLNFVHVRIFQSTCEEELSRYIREVESILSYITSKYDDYVNADTHDEILSELGEVKYSIPERILILYYLELGTPYKLSNIHEKQYVSAVVIAALFNNKPEKLRQNLFDARKLRTKKRLDKIKGVFNEFPEIIKRIEKDYLEVVDG